jgi:hypothetical protein
VADGVAAVSSIPPAAVKSLLDIADRIIQMMDRADDPRLLGRRLCKALFDDVGAPCSSY